MSTARSVPRQLWSITWPLILASSSTCLMSLTGRCILAHYSQEAFNVHIGVAVWYEVLQSVLLNLISIIGVFIGHFNGRKQFSQIGPAVWQMLWLSFGIGIFALPILWILAPYLLASNLEASGVPYLKMLLLSIPFHCATFGAIGAFFTGRKITYVLPILIVFAHIVDIVFAILLIFGKGGFPECGLLGCAIATIIAQICSLIAIFPIFFAKRNREIFHTGHSTFSLTTCWRYVRFGIPSSLNSLINGVAWCWIIQVIADRTSFSEFSALGIIFTLLRIMSFLSESLGKGNCILVANFLGEKQDKITIITVLSAALKLWFIIASILLLSAWVFSREFVDFFIINENPEIFSMFWQMLPWASLLALLEGIWYQLHYSLTAFKDTSFLASVNIGSHFIFLIIPAYFFLCQEHPHTVIILQLMILHQFVRSCVLRWRYKIQIPKVMAAEA
ncbi:MAG: hypothetical protein LBD40_03565 [Puniceicoccales bacterium]|nr:hypothetical protein [Puniceicoccales bacterium]